MALSVAVLGTGLMGRGMVRSLLRAGHSVRVWNRTRAKAEEAAGDPKLVAASPAHAVRGVDFALTMLADPAALNAVFEGADGLLDGLQSKTVVIDSSTVSPPVILRLAEKVKAKGASMLDAPVFGSKNEAENGQLGFMVGGDPAVFERAKPLLVGVLGKAATLMGPQGAGSAAKLVWNLVVSIQLEGVLEGLALAAKAGLDPGLVYDVLMTGRAKCGIAEMKLPNVLKGDFQPFFALKLMDKDLRLALETAEALKVPMPALAAAKQVFTACMAQGQAEEDFSTIVKHHERLAGVEVRRKA
jgi:3-hydroxyisobutyrate dehydrogenase